VVERRQGGLWKSFQLSLPREEESLNDDFDDAFVVVVDVSFFPFGDQQETG